jgi:hypothetical protein
MIKGDKPRRGEGWRGRVAFAGGTDGFAYVPEQVLAVDYRDEILERAREMVPGLQVEGLALQNRRMGRITRVPDVPAMVRHLRSFGFQAQPDHVFFAHCGEGASCCGPHPAVRAACAAGPAASPVYASPVYASPVYASPVYASPVYASPVYASPVYASPVYASPVYASPVYASPVYASPVYASTYIATGHRRSSAVPVQPADAANVLGRLEHIDEHVEEPSPESPPDVVVLDTGYATDSELTPTALADLGSLIAPRDDGPLPVEDRPDAPPDDGLLDPAAGHGTFIAGLVQQVAPGAKVELWRVLHPQGDGTESAIAAAVDALTDTGTAAPSSTCPSGATSWRRARCFPARSGRRRPRATSSSRPPATTASAARPTRPCCPTSSASARSAPAAPRRSATTVPGCGPALLASTW